MLAELPGFVANMDRSAVDGAGPWKPCPVMLAMAEPNGPVDGVVQNPPFLGYTRRAEIAGL
jgi:hypothetical protein